jgi:prophage regulatory protein
MADRSNDHTIGKGAAVLPCQPDAPIPDVRGGSLSAGNPPGQRPARRRRQLKPLVADAKLLARLLGVSVRSIRGWDYGGKLPRPVRLGSRAVWLIEEVRCWLAAGAPDRSAWETLKKVCKVRP